MIRTSFGLKRKWISQTFIVLAFWGIYSAPTLADSRDPISDEVCQERLSSARQQFAATLAVTREALSAYVNYGQKRLAPRVSSQVSKLHEIQNALDPALRSEALQLIDQGARILQDSQLSSDEKLRIYEANRETLSELMESKFSFERFSKKDYHTGILGSGDWLRRSVFMDIRGKTGASSSSAGMAICARTSELTNNCRILRDYDACVRESLDSTVVSCFDLVSGKLSGRDWSDARVLARNRYGSDAGTLAPELPVESDWIARYMQAKYPDCVKLIRKQ